MQPHVMPLKMDRREWSPHYTPESLLREAATRLQDRFLFGSDSPFITPQRWMRDFEAGKIEFKPEVREKLFWRNGQKLLAHTAVGHMHFALEGGLPAYAFCKECSELMSFFNRERRVCA